MVVSIHRQPGTHPQRTMNDREKRLILVLAFIGLVIAGLFGYKVYARALADVRSQKRIAELTLDSARRFIEEGEQFADQSEWLAQNEPEPQAIQLVRSNTEQLATEKARAAGLTVVSTSIDPKSEGDGGYYGRARVTLKVTGTEKALYEWLHQIQSPKDFRTVITMDLEPLRDDPTKISCTVVVEQWFVPQPSAS